jgi:hypothetical protein
MHRLLVPALLAGALAVPAGAAAQGAPADCHLMSPRASAEHAIPGTGLVARDPYGGLLSRNRLFFDFSVRGPQAALANVAKVTWALDGTVVREDPKAPFEWKGLSGSSKRMPAGDHTITVTVVPKSGTPASTQFALTATDCQPVSFSAEVPKRSGIATFSFDSAFESSNGEPLDAVKVSASTNVATALPARLRGRKAGTLTIDRKSYTLRVPRGRGRTLLRRGALQVVLGPGRSGFLNVRGLPEGTQSVQVRLVPGIVRVRDAGKAFSVRATFVAGSRAATATSGGRYV